MYDNEMRTPSLLKALWENTNKIQKILFLVILVIVVLIIVVSVFILTQGWREKSGLVITNYGEYSSTPEDFKENVEERVYNLIVNAKLVSQDTKIDGRIREGSYSEDIRDGVAAISLMIDIPMIEQSYNVNYNFPTNYRKSRDDVTDYEVIINCPTVDEFIYDSPCKISADSFDNIAVYLPATIESNTLGQIDISTQVYGKYTLRPGQSYISLEFDNCDGDFNSAPYRRALEGWLRERKIESLEGINIEYYPYCPVQGEVE